MAGNSLYIFMASKNRSKSQAKWMEPRLGWKELVRGGLPETVLRSSSTLYATTWKHGPVFFLLIMAKTYVPVHRFTWQSSSTVGRIDLMLVERLRVPSCSAPVLCELECLEHCVNVEPWRSRGKLDYKQLLCEWGREGFQITIAGKRKRSNERELGLTEG